MTNDQILEVCKRELLFGTAFLNDYQEELSELLGDSTFIQVVNEISNSISDEIEFSSDPFSPQFINFKKQSISDSFF